MKVHELIAELEELEPDERIFIVHEIRDPVTNKIKLDVNKISVVQAHDVSLGGRNLNVIYVGDNIGMKTL